MKKMLFALALTVALGGTTHAQGYYGYPPPAPYPYYGCEQPDEYGLQSHRCYQNRDGYSVHSPSRSYGGPPLGATARCADGTWSFSQHRSGTCSHHGGVAY